MEVKDYIVEEADKLFCQYGFKSVTMDDIAKQLGMSKKTIYQHFSDKDELVNILIQNKLDKQLCNMKEGIAVAENAVAEIFFSITSMHAQLTTMNAKLFFDLQKYHPKAWLLFKAFKEKNLRESIEKNLIKGIEQGLYRDDINIEVLTMMRIYQLELVFDQHIGDQTTIAKFGISRIMIEITEHYLYGICSDKGLALVKEYKEKYKPQYN